MTREELIEAIIAEAVQGMAGGMGPDWATAASDQEFTFQNMVGRIAASKKRKQMGFKNPGIHESMNELHRVAKNSTLNRGFQTAMKPVVRSFKRNVVRPFTSTKRALRYRDSANMAAVSGHWDRALTMHRRAAKVIRGHAPALAGAAVGIIGGTVFPSPGATEMGAIMGAKGGRVVNHLAQVGVKARTRAVERIKSRAKVRAGG